MKRTTKATVTRAGKILHHTWPIGVVALKIWGDHRRHKDHKGHNQRCDCMGNCWSCTFANAIAPIKKAWDEA